MPNPNSLFLTVSGFYTDGQTEYIYFMGSETLPSACYILFDESSIPFYSTCNGYKYTERACLITKGYVLVFVCFSTKTIHLEPTSDLSTEKFLRFVSRRGCPRQVQSDNGKTLVGASTLLSRDFLQAVKESVTDAYSHQQLNLQFIPPGARHIGGQWEAIINLSIINR